MKETQNRFPQTNWTQLIDEDLGKQTSNFINSYYNPTKNYIERYLRKRNITKRNADDLAQDFILKMLVKDFFSGLERQERPGAFRKYLRTSINNFLKNQFRGDFAQKRGGKIKHISLDQVDDEQLSLQEKNDFDYFYAKDVLIETFELIKKNSEELFLNIKQEITQGEICKANAKVINCTMDIVLRSKKVPNQKIQEEKYQIKKSLLKGGIDGIYRDLKVN